MYYILDVLEGLALSLFNSTFLISQARFQDIQTVTKLKMNTFIFYTPVYLSSERNTLNGLLNSLMHDDKILLTYYLIHPKYKYLLSEM